MPRRSDPATPAGRRASRVSPVLQRRGRSVTVSRGLYGYSIAASIAFVWVRFNTALVNAVLTIEGRGIRHVDAHTAGELGGFHRRVSDRDWHEVAGRPPTIVSRR